MTIEPPNPYAVAAVSAAAKTLTELAYKDVKAGIKSGVSELLRFVQEIGAEKARQNAQEFQNALEHDIEQRISIGVSPDGYERIEGNLRDADFAYIVRQATIASARTSDEQKRRILARAVTERLMSATESLVARACSTACEVVPNLTPKLLEFLGLATLVLGIRPTIVMDEQDKTDAHGQQKVYVDWLRQQLGLHRPFPTMRGVDYLHLEGMSCIMYSTLEVRSWPAMLMPRDLPLFEWPANFLDSDELVLELKQVDGLAKCIPTTVGQVIGTMVHDLKSNQPTVFKWED